jgi:magnesium transporter
MIRSLVAPAALDIQDDFTPRRNLSRENLEQSLNNQDTVWVDVVDPDEDEIAWLEQVLRLHPAIVQDLGREDRRPTLMVYPSYMFLSLFQPHLRLNSVEGREIHCLVDSYFFITVRKSDAGAVEEAYNRVAQNPDSWRHGAPYFLYLTIQYVIDGYYPLLDRMSNQLSQLEESIMGGTVGDKTRKPVYSIKQQLINLRQMIAPQREVLSSVVGESRLTGDPEIRDLFRHLYERLLRIYDVIDAQRDLSSNVLDMVQSQESSRLVEVVSRLTIFSMIFLPLTFFISFFSLDFATIAEPAVLPVSGEVLFGLVLTAMTVSVAGMVYFFRRRGWL